MPTSKYVPVPARSLPDVTKPKLSVDEQAINAQIKADELRAEAVAYWDKEFMRLVDLKREHEHTGAPIHDSKLWVLLASINLAEFPEIQAGTSVS